jgi:hypothetical protein
VRFCSSEIRLDHEDRLLGHELDTRVDDAVDPAHEVSHLVRLAAQDVEVLTIEAHHEGFVRSRQDIEGIAGIRRFSVDKCPDVADLLLRVGYDLAVHRLVKAAHDVLDRRHRRVIVGVGADVDREGAGVDVDDLIPVDGTSDVATNVLDPRDRSQLAT